MRCLTLANELREQGAEITFLCREHEGHLFNVIVSSNHRLLCFSPAIKMAKGKLAHAPWLGTTQEEDALQTEEVLKVIGYPDWLVVDHYALDVEWEKSMRSCVKHIMVIDDLADRVHDCDVLLDQNLHLTDMETRYDKLVPSFCKKLLGPKYALLRPEFKKVRSSLKVRDGNVKRIFVFFGVSDSTNETGKTLRAIQQLDRSDIAIDVVVGSTNLHQKDIAGLCAQFSEAELHRQVNNISELMARADVAIGAGGSTTWERCALSLPGLTISLAENQVSIAEGVGETNAQIYLGEASQVTSEIITAQLERLLQRPQNLIDMSKAGQRLVDTNGSHRVIKVLRKAT